MSTVERSRTIPAAIDRLWDVLADFDHLAVWAPNADHTCWMNDAAVDGEMVGRARRVQAGRVVLVETVTAWEPPMRLAYDLAGLPPIVRSAANEWRLRLDQPGRTVVTLTTSVDCGSRPPQRFAARLVAQRLAKASDQMLDGLATYIASRPSDRPATDRTPSVTSDPASCDSSTEGVQP